MKKISHCFFIVLCLISTVSISCNKLIDIPGSESLVETNIVFSDSSTAVAALLNAYITLDQSMHSSITSLYADDYAYTAVGPELEYYRSQVLVNNPINTVWEGLYLLIYQCNAIIEESEKSLNLSLSTKAVLNGEAKFLRAYAHFCLINLYDRIPLILSTDVNENRRASQRSTADVYAQIIDDLQDAKVALGSSYSGTGKVRANSWAASALLARVYLYLNRWADAEKEAAGVINSALYTPLPPLPGVFIADSKETILQLWNQNGVLNDATSFIPASPVELPAYIIADPLLSAFDNADGRKDSWISTNTVSESGISTVYYYPSKYKNRVANMSAPEYKMVLRLSEQYLIRAEALAQQNDLAGAIADVNIIRQRAGGILPLENDVSKVTCLNAIYHERQLELFGEWGHRFFDLKRTSQLDVVLGSIKPSWKPSAKALPIPQSEIIYNANLIQNDGY